MQAFAQGRDLHDGSRKAKVRSSPKLAVVDVGAQVAVRGGNDPHVERSILVTAHAAHLAALERTQKARLQVERQFSDFVEEQRSSVGAFERARMSGHRAGERSAFVPEQLAFRQVCGHCAAIEHHEWAGCARALLVQCAGQHVFAGARFADEGDRHLGRRKTLQDIEDVVHRFRRGHDFAEATNRRHQMTYQRGVQ